MRLWNNSKYLSASRAVFWKRGYSGYRWEPKNAFVRTGVLPEWPPFLRLRYLGLPVLELVACYRKGKTYPLRLHDDSMNLIELCEYVLVAATV